MLPAHTHKVEYRYSEVKGTKIASNFQKAWTTRIMTMQTYFVHCCGTLKHILKSYNNTQEYTKKNS